MSMQAKTNLDGNKLKTETTQSPTILSFCSDIGTPVSVFETLSKDADNAFLFESTEGDSRLARYSFLGIDPCLTVSFSNGVAVVQTQTGKRKEEPVSDPIDYLQQTLSAFRKQFLGGNGHDASNL